VKILFDLLEEQKKPDGRVWVTTGSTFDNAGNLSAAYLTAIKGVYDGTDQAKQELYGQMLAEAEGALWTDAVINDNRVKTLPPYTPLRIIGVDPSVAENPGDECGIVVVGSTSENDLFKRHAWVMEDASLKGAPHIWAAEVVRMANKWGCPVVAETNQGGALVANAIHQIDPSVTVLEVHSKVGKKLRAEPVTLAYQQGRVHHTPGLRGVEKGLEDQMVGWLPEGSKSPDRVDALVHALTALLISPPSGYSGGVVRAKPMSGRRIKTLTSPTAAILSGRGRGIKGANTGSTFRIR
jgi:phage terminase large subunit-like protein